MDHSVGHMAYMFSSAFRHGKRGQLPEGEGCMPDGSLAESNTVLPLHYKGTQTGATCSMPPRYPIASLIFLSITPLVLLHIR